MKKQLLRYLVLISFVVILLIPKRFAWGCIPEISNDDANFLLFRNYLPESGLDDFYFSHSYFEKGNGSSDKWINCKEWRKYTDNSVAEKDIYLLQYNVSASEFLYCVSTGNWGSLAYNTFVKWLLLKNHSDALKYFAFAKKAEMNLISDSHPWAYNSWDEGYEQDLLKSDSLSDIALINCNSDISGFLIERYAFQAVKLLHYKSTLSVVDSGKINKQIISIYDRYLKGKNTIVAGWGLLYYSLCIENSLQRNILLLQTFDICDEKRVYITRNLSIDTVNSLLPHIRNSDLYPVALAYKSIKNSGRSLKDIRELYSVDKNSKYLPLLVSREVNKLETWILAPEVRGFYSNTNRKSDIAYLKEVRTFLEEIVADANNKDFFLLATIHLYHIEKDFVKAAKYLAHMQKLNNKELEIQRLTEAIISLMYTSDIKHTNIKEQLEHNFSALEQLGLSDNRLVKNEYDDLEWIEYDISGSHISRLYLLLSNNYKQRGDIVTASMLFNKASIIVDGYYGINYDNDYYSTISFFDKHGTASDVDSIVKFIYKLNKSPFEKRISTQVNQDIYRYLEVKSTILLRQGKFEEALSVMQSLPDNYWESQYSFSNYLKHSNVSSVYINYHSNTKVSKQSFLPDYNIVSKKLIVSDIVMLQKQLKNATTDSVKAITSYLLGNSFYNISYFGKDWMVFSYGKSHTEMYDITDCIYFYNFYPNRISLGDIYYNGKWAIDMYKNALKFANGNKELTAACLLMLGDINIASAKYSPYLKTLFTNHKDSKIYEYCITECPDIADQIKK